MSRGSRMPGLAVEVMESLYQHRLLSTNQIRLVHAPNTTPRWVQSLLAQLAQHRLVEAARGRGALKVWYLTETGAEAVEAIATRTEPRRKLLAPAQAAGQLQQHTLAVNDVGVAYLQAARERGDEFGPLSWRHEIAHPISPRKGRGAGEVVIADAVLSYLIADEHTVSVQQRFVELDRGTMPVEQLVAKLERYLRLARYTPDPPPGEDAVAGWRSSYRTFPRVQVILANRPRHLLQRRMRLLLALAYATPALRNDRTTGASITLLEDLAWHGPFAAIWHPVTNPTRAVTWLGNTERDTDGRGRAA